MHGNFASKCGRILAFLWRNFADFYQEISVLVMFAAIAFIAAYFFPILLKEGIPASVDLPHHFLRAKLISQGYGLYDWYYGMWLGTTPFVFYPPLAAWFVAIVPAASLNLISLELSFKFMIWITYWGISFSIYYALRLWRFQKATALLAAFLSLFVSYFAGVGPNAVFEIGLFPFGFANLFFLPALAHIDCYLFEDRSHKHLFLSVAFSCIMALSNVGVVAFFSIFMGAYILSEVLITRRFQVLEDALKYGLLVTGLCAFWLIPFVCYQGLLGPDANWSTMTLSNLISSLMTGRFFGPTLLNIWAALGFGISIFAISDRRVRCFSWLLFLAICLGLNYVSILPFSHNGLLNKVLGALTNRALVYLAYSGILFSVYPFERIFARMKISTGWQLTAIGIVAFVFLGFSGERWLREKSHLVRTEADYQTPKDGEFRQILGWLDRNAPDKTVSSEPFFSDPQARDGLSYQHLGIWVGIKTRSIPLEGSVSYFSKASGAIMGHRFAEAGENSEMLMRSWDVNYIVTGRNARIPYAHRVFVPMSGEKRGQIAVFEIRYPDNAVNILDKTFGANFVEFGVAARRDGWANLPIGYHPNWRVTVDGAASMYDEDSAHLVRLQLTKGRHVVRFQLHKGCVEYWSLAITLTMLICSFWALRIGRGPIGIVGHDHADPSELPQELRQMLRRSSSSGLWGWVFPVIMAAVLCTIILSAIEGVLGFALRHPYFANLPFGRLSH